MSTFPYFPHTPQNIADMLEKVGAKDIGELYADVPERFIRKEPYDLPDAMSEQEVRDFFSSLASCNTPLKVFAGGGAYDHYSPSVIQYIISRSEFLTAYTPYQPEISQGTLRYIFEFQTMICRLTGMDVSNASMYDGPTAAAEAMRMTMACTKRRSRILVSSTLLPQVRQVVETYAGYSGIQVSFITSKDGQTSLDVLRGELASGDVAGVLVPSVNRFGIIEDLTGFADAIHSAGALGVMYCDPSALAVLKDPGSLGFDIAVGDGQSLGLPLNFGGPYVGFMACRREYMRKLPGRIVGRTVDMEGRRAYVLTLQAREQHIKREKATSNICSNQSLMALYATVYLSLMGYEGLRRVNALSCSGAHWLHDRLIATGKFRPVFDRPFLKEFVLQSERPALEIAKALSDKGFLAAVPTEEGYCSFCVTEKRTKEETGRLADIIAAL